MGVCVWLAPSPTACLIYSPGPPSSTASLIWSPSPLQVRHNSLFVARTTYFNRIKDGAIPASVMDFDIDAVTGQVRLSEHTSLPPSLLTGCLCPLSLLLLHAFAGCGGQGQRGWLPGLPREQVQPSAVLEQGGGQRALGAL